MKLQVGDKVLKNKDAWIPTNFDKWGRGIGIGEVIEVVEDDIINVRWLGGRCYENPNQLKLIKI